MIISLSTFIVYFAYLAFGLKRLLTYLHALQQDDYDNTRFLSWVLTNRVFDKKLSIALLLIVILGIIMPFLLVNILLSCAFLYVAYTEKDPRYNAKKKFVLTPRVKRILGIALFGTALIGAWCFLLPLPLLWIVSVQLVPMILALANAILQPAEQRIQQKYWDEAHVKITALKPIIIGITGSFGKTSVKHILGHILKTQNQTLITPGSTNTAMGTARIIRERLEPTHKYFIAEMGAYGPGSIEKLCRLTPPDLGIITAIGAAHYERFKSLETVAAAKFELAQSVIEKNGKIVLPFSITSFSTAQNLLKNHKDNFVIVGENPETGDSNLHIQKIEQKTDGLRVTIFSNGTLIELQAPLYGTHHALNIVLAYEAALHLGVPAEDILTALRSTPQIQHRLEVKPQGDGTILIDDAFNSNPVGFAAALDLMPILVKNEGRKILITPGMVELGDEHDEAHEKIGVKAGQICDIVLLVRAQRIPSFAKGFRTTGADKTLIEVGSFQEASQWLQRNLQGSDVVLIENDLPDIYESLPKI